ncbi:MAG: transcriptional repressor, partial [Phascolarctobacterium sp.]|nr:transcriptional repressor [Phascolarctobacterium sp.]
MLTGKELTQLLRDKGYKVTPQRLAAYETLTAENAHPTAEVFFSKLQAECTAMSLATVYKTLEILSRLSVINVPNVGEDSFRFDAVKEDHHVRCTNCGAVMDVHAPDSTRLAKAVEAASGYKVKGHQFYFYGLCPQMRFLSRIFYFAEI